MHDSAIDHPPSSDDTAAPPPGVLVSDHFRESFGYRVRRTTGTRDWLITYTVGGTGRFRRAGAVHLCEAGDVVILAPGSPHDYATVTTGRPWNFYWAHFVPRPSWTRWLQLPEVSPGLYRLSIRDPVVRRRTEQAFERLLQDNHGLGALREELAQNALEEVLLLIAQHHSRHSAEPLDPRIEAVLHHLSQHLSDALSVAALAATVSLSPSRLAHLFKQQVGDSLMETLLKLRLRQAARLLEWTSRPVGEIAWDVGFQSPFYFSRQFKAYYGISPSVYRARLHHSTER